MTALALAPLLDVYTIGKTAPVTEASTRVLLALLGRREKILTSRRLPSQPDRSLRRVVLAARLAPARISPGSTAWPFAMKPRSRAATSL